MARASSSARSLTSTAYTVACGRTVASTQAIGPYPQPRSRNAPAVAAGQLRLTQQHGGAGVEAAGREHPGRRRRAGTSGPPASKITSVGVAGAWGSRRSSGRRSPAHSLRRPATCGRTGVRGCRIALGSLSSMTYGYGPAPREWPPSDGSESDPDRPDVAVVRHSRAVRAAPPSAPRVPQPPPPARHLGYPTGRASHRRALRPVGFGPASHPTRSHTAPQPHAAQHSAPPALPRRPANGPARTPAYPAYPPPVPTSPVVPRHGTRPARRPAAPANPIGQSPARRGPVPANWHRVCPLDLVDRGGPAPPVRPAQAPAPPGNGPQPQPGNRASPGTAPRQSPGTDAPRRPRPAEPA